MRSVLFFTLVFSVASVFGQQPFVRHPDNLRKAVPHHFNHDQKNAYRSVDKIARGHKVGPRQAPLRPQQTVPWLQWVQEGRWAAQADRNSEMLKVRAKLLEEKLKPNQFIFKPQINPQLKPKLNKKENGRIKREIEESRRKSNKEIKVNENPRHKRDVIMSQHIPKVVMPSEDQFEGRIKETEKRHKRQIVYFINRPPQLLARSPRTTPNPFIRDTHIDDYDIIRPEVGEREGMIPTVESGSSDPGSYPLVNIPQALFRFLQFAKFKVEQSFLSKTDKQNSIAEEPLVRVKRRMSRFVRDKKQMTRKKKIGRAKKTKVKRTPVKVRKWYDKRQKVKKKGDGTYRGGRGRKPRQHKRPRHYKPPMNETSDYDYYDSKGNIRGDEKQEGPDVADYLSYVSGEYSDTEEAERANQEMEKEYQEQLKRQRLREKKQKLSNVTEESPEELEPLPYSGSHERKKDSNTEQRVKLNEIKKEEKKKIHEKGRAKSADSEDVNESLPERQNYKGGRNVKQKVSSEESEESQQESSEEDVSEDKSTAEDSSEEESTEEDSSEEESTEEDSSDEDKTEEDSSDEDKTEEDSSDEDKTEDSKIDESSQETDEDSSGKSSGDKKRRKFPRKYRKSPRWKQGKTGKYESDPRKIENKQSLANKDYTKISSQAQAQKHFSSNKDYGQNHAVLSIENTNSIDHQKKSTLRQSKASESVRKAARKFDFFSLSSYPIIRNFMTTGENQPPNVLQNFLQPKNLLPNRISSLKFETPPHIAIHKLESTPLKSPPDVVSMSHPKVDSRGGENLKNLQSKKVETTLESTFKDQRLISIAHDKPKDTLTLISETKDERKKWTSTGSDHMRSIQSKKVDPVVLTSIAKSVPELGINSKEILKAINKNVKRVEVKSDHNERRIHLGQQDVLTSIAKNIPPLNVDDGKAKTKREVNEEEQKDISYEELSKIPDSAGESVPSDEIEPASDDRK